MAAVCIPGPRLRPNRMALDAALSIGGTDVPHQLGPRANAQFAAAAGVASCGRENRSFPSQFAQDLPALQHSNAAAESQAGEPVAVPVVSSTPRFEVAASHPGLATWLPSHPMVPVPQPVNAQPWHRGLPVPEISPSPMCFQGGVPFSSAPTQTPIQQHPPAPWFHGGCGPYAAGTWPTLSPMGCAPGRFAFAGTELYAPIGLSTPGPLLTPGLPPLGIPHQGVVLDPTPKQEVVSADSVPNPPSPTTGPCSGLVDFARKVLGDGRSGESMTKGPESDWAGSYMPSQFPARNTQTSPKEQGPSAFPELVPPLPKWDAQAHPTSEMPTHLGADWGPVKSDNTFNGFLAGRREPGLGTRAIMFAEDWVREANLHPDSSGCITYPNGSTVNLLETASLLRPTSSSISAVHRAIAAQSVEQENHRSRLLDAYHRADKERTGILTWANGEIRNFVASTFHERGLVPPTETQMYAVYTSFDRGRTMRLEARECLYLADALLRASLLATDAGVTSRASLHDSDIGDLLAAAALEHPDQVDALAEARAETERLRRELQALQDLEAIVNAEETAVASARTGKPVGVGTLSPTPLARANDMEMGLISPERFEPDHQMPSLISGAGAASERGAITDVEVSVLMSRIPETLIAEKADFPVETDDTSVLVRTAKAHAENARLEKELATLRDVASRQRGEAKWLRDIRSELAVAAREREMFEASEHRRVLQHRRERELAEAEEESRQDQQRILQLEAETRREHSKLQKMQTEVLRRRQRETEELQQEGKLEQKLAYEREKTLAAREARLDARRQATERHKHEVELLRQKNSANGAAELDETPSRISQRKSTDLSTSFQSQDLFSPWRAHSLDTPVRRRNPVTETNLGSIASSSAEGPAATTAWENRRLRSELDGLRALAQWQQNEALVYGNASTLADRGPRAKSASRGAIGQRMSHLANLSKSFGCESSNGLLEDDSQNTSMRTHLDGEFNTQLSIS